MKTLKVLKALPILQAYLSKLLGQPTKDKTTKNTIL